MEGIAGTVAEHAAALMTKTSAALYAVAEMLEAARRVSDGNAVDAAEFALEALLTAARNLPAPAPAAVQCGGNVVPFRKRV